MLRFLLLFLLAGVVYRAIGRLIGGVIDGATGRTAGTSDSRNRAAAREPVTPARMVKDPVCGTFLVPGRGPSAERGGETVWFCSERCRETFERL